MATITSAGNGNWNTGATWVGGVVPTPADDVVIGNGHAITVDVNVTVLSCKTTAGSNTRVVIPDSFDFIATGEGIQGAGGAAFGFIEVTAAAGKTINISGIIRSGGGYSIGCINVVGGCTVNINGIYYGGSSAEATYGNTIAVRGAGCVVNVTGVFIGTQSGPNPKPVVYASNSANKVINVSGVFTSDLAGCVQSDSTSDTITVNGVLTASSSSNVIIATAGALVRLGAVEMHNTSDRSALLAAKWRFINATDDAEWVVNTDTMGVFKRLYTASELTGYPAENKVEDGTVYGPSSEFEGTMEPWDATFAQALATAQRDLQLPSILSAITAP